MTRPLPDEPARTAIEHDLDTTFLVEAAAGTGKTTSLVGRMTALVRTGSCAVDTMAAITFTVKAAAQLREAFQEKLEHALTLTEGDELARLRTARGSLDKGFIGTIHAFCARLLRERPVEAGLDPGFEELPDDEQQSWPLAWWHEHVEWLGAEGDPALQRLGDTGIAPASLAESFKKLVDYPDVEFDTNDVKKPDLRPAFDAIATFLDDAGRVLPTAVYTEKEELPQILIELGDRIGGIDRDDAAAVAGLLDRFDTGKGVTLRNWDDEDLAKRIRDEHKRLKEETVRPALVRWREYLHPFVMAVIVPALARFRRERIAAGRLTFQDLLLSARDLLRDHPKVRDYFARRFTHILVDEFQDTDPIQAEVLFYLCGSTPPSGGGFQSAASPSNAPPRKSHDSSALRAAPSIGMLGHEAIDPTPTWRDFLPRPGSLFIVGDPKQSIYRFRRADITTYDDVKNRIEAAGGKSLQLRANFRSTPSVCAHVNAVFEPLFKGDDIREKRQAAYVKLEAQRGEAPLSGVRLLKGRTVRGEVRIDDLVEQQAAQIAGWIRGAVDRGLVVVEKEGSERAARWGDFLVVSRTKARLALFARALEERSVPYDITGGAAFASSEEIAPLLIALRAIAEPEDEVAVAAYLRGPLCGASDADLFEYVNRGGRFSWQSDSLAPSAQLSPLSERPPTLSSRAQRGTSQASTDEPTGKTVPASPLTSSLESATAPLPPIPAALTLLRSAAHRAKSLPPAAAIAALATTLGLGPWAAAGERGKSRAGNVRKLVMLARERARRGLSFAEVVGELRAMVDPEEDVKIEELSIDPARSDVVRVMNLHQVKGLEAPFVFLVDPGGEHKPDPKLAIDRMQSPPKAWARLTRAYGQSARTVAQPLEWEAKSAAEAEFERCETERLLYVAATRAKQLLVISVVEQATKFGGVWSNLANNLPAIPDLEEIESLERRESNLSSRSLRSGRGTSQASTHSLSTQPPKNAPSPLNSKFEIRNP